MDTSVVTRKGQVTIPARLRRHFDLDVGARVEFVVHNGAILIRPVENSVEAAFGLLRPTQTASLEDMDRAIRNRGQNQRR